jgi:hypothetical protein
VRGSSPLSLTSSHARDTLDAWVETSRRVAAGA